MSRQSALGLIIACFVVLAGTVPGCDAGSAGARHPELSATGSTTAPLATKAVCDIVAEINAAQAPSGVSPAVFAELKAELTRTVLARGVSKITSAPPTGDLNAVTDLTVIQWKSA